MPAARCAPTRTASRRSLRNLARNAVEHTRPGGLVRVSATALPRGWVEIAVEDDGPGIPPAQRDRVFDRFHRLDSARARGKGGAGLGLAIARAIVEAHGGRIGAGASPEGGARVAFRLPGFRPAGARRPAAASTAGGLDRPSRGGRRAADAHVAQLGGRPSAAHRPRSSGRGSADGDRGGARARRRRRRARARRRQRALVHRRRVHRRAAC